jgi:16S rRNA (adenine1518-N6/adenine1519-N6)-dimethyltransferase
MLLINWMLPCYAEMTEKLSHLPPLNVRALLRQYGIQPDRRMGQNFLVEPGALRKVIEAALPLGGETVLEIGPGLGSLTRYLAEHAGRVVAVELDKQFFPVLKEVLAPWPGVELVQGDILSYNPASLGLPDRYLVVANIPYYITSAVIRHLLETTLRPSRLVLTVQREVAERLCAGAGEMSLLALSVQIYGRPQIAARLPAEAFYPVPKVDSATVRVEIYPEPLLPGALLGTFFQLARSGFSQKRKTLRNALSAGLGWHTSQVEDLLQSGGIDQKRRAETLELGEWLKLTRLVQAQQK